LLPRRFGAPELGRCAKKEDMMKIIKRNSWVRYSISVFVLGAILLTGCGKNERIEGKFKMFLGTHCRTLL